MMKIISRGNTTIRVAAHTSLQFAPVSACIANIARPRVRGRFSLFVSFFLGAAFFGAAVTVFKYCSSFGSNFGSHLFQMRADIY